MNVFVKFMRLALLVLCGLILLSSFLALPDHRGPDARPVQKLSLPTFQSAGRPYSHRPRKFPWRAAGLTERQAAAHLLSRFTFGAAPGQVNEVVKTGLEKWFRHQLDADLPEDSLDAMLAPYDALRLNNAQIAAAYPRNGQVIRMAVKDGYVDKDSVKTDRKEYRDVIRNYMREKGLKPEQELFRELYCQKVIRAAHAENQLREVMTDFWFNHFNVSITKGDCARFIPVYERDVIRRGALGKFGELLKATAQSPAMLYYLDNFSSSGPMEEKRDAADTAGARRRRRQGLNENYARELMELHTLGVDGGYTQQDVTQAARVLTGWTVFPMGDNGKAQQERMERMGPDKMQRQGFVHEGDFFFAANRHDKDEKTVLGKRFAANGGYEEGVQLLDMLAHHPSTAKFISKKIATRFVSDNPPAGLIDKMAKTFLDKDGDIREVLLTMVTAPEFWTASAIREKTKSPFELAIGAVRSLQARVDEPIQLYNWVTRMGEKMYFYQAPTGFPDKGQYWINTGSLLNRMNFGLAFTTGRIPGVSLDLARLNNNHEPESTEAALATYCRLIMPERDVEPTIKRLTPMLNDPSLQQKVNAASKRANEAAMGQDSAAAISANTTAMAPVTSANSTVSLPQVVGVIIGSPEFQRR